jgi:hypothetical protein
VSWMLKKMQWRGFIGEADCPSSSTVELVRKKNGNVHISVDNRKQNCHKEGLYPITPDLWRSGHAGWSQMVHHSRLEELLLASGSTFGRQ